MSDEIDTNQNEEEEIIMEDIRKDHCRDVAEDGEDKSNIHNLNWDVYTRGNKKSIKRYF